MIQLQTYFRTSKWLIDLSLPYNEQSLVICFCPSSHCSRSFEWRKKREYDVRNESLHQTFTHVIQNGTPTGTSRWLKATIQENTWVHKPMSLLNCTSSSVLKATLRHVRYKAKSSDGNKVVSHNNTHKKSTINQ